MRATSASGYWDRKIASIELAATVSVAFSLKKTVDQWITDELLSEYSNTFLRFMPHWATGRANQRHDCFHQWMYKKGDSISAIGARFDGSGFNKQHGIHLPFFITEQDLKGSWGY